MQAGTKRESSHKAGKLVTTSFRVEADLLEQFRAKAAENFRSPSWEIRRLMTEYLEQEAPA